MRRILVVAIVMLLASPIMANDTPMPEYEPPSDYSEQYEPYDYDEPPPEYAHEYRDQSKHFREPKRRRKHKIKRIIRKVRKVLDVIEAFADNPEIIEGFLK